MTIIVVGASGLAREAVAVLRESGRRISGILDDRLVLGDEFAQLPVLGPTRLAPDFPDAEFVLAIGNSAARVRVAATLHDAGISAQRFARVIDPSVRNPADCAIGAGSILLAGVTVTAAAQVGEHVVAMPRVTITHDCVVADGVTLTAGVSLGGGVQLQRGAWVGMNASIHPGIRIGEGAVVGMGAVVLEDIPSGETWAGNPARRIGGSP